MDIYKNVAWLDGIPYAKYLSYQEARDSSLKISVENKSRPIMLDCETINTCTNDCIICAYGMMKRDKTVMPLERFEKVLHDYSDMGGGYLSLTPRGEIFLDPLLVERLSLRDKYPKIKGISVTTNAVPINRFSESDIRKILNSFIRIHISIYGLDDEEYRLMTRRDFYPRVVANIKTITELIDQEKTSLRLGFRLLKAHSETDIRDWIKKNLGRDDIPYGYMSTYTNWRGALKDPLPFEGKWQARSQGKSHCLMPLIETSVYCTEFDLIEEFKLGNIDDHSLGELYNSDRNKELWTNLPKPCLTCSYYHPITQPSQITSAFQDPVNLIGG